MKKSTGLFGFSGVLLIIALLFGACAPASPAGYQTNSTQGGATEIITPAYLVRCADILVGFAEEYSVVNENGISEFTFTDFYEYIAFGPYAHREEAKVYGVQVSCVISENSVSEHIKVVYKYEESK
ncbi:hypothetical protein A2415_00955 [candidate division WWE3 bacterium RIFOXYC1_FULL_39_7]|uniref:DUF4377 domain-containing protein n=2 Tax=Katanobacteria TaxID=422282 RepID=A0A1F4X6W1_UNCKA|nr:MAG: hypothetical protein A2415_00955 [candidate division WWE3 bacterium RIFOXYC1_FULL_39_7]OGC77440.1 MAG: hypothetical protein A2619_03775 [candidate division WWE3 bacterium RIFOXYD1_FULL_39_9]